MALPACLDVFPPFLPLAILYEQVFLNMTGSWGLTDRSDFL
jgi:hypothetical protein